MLRSLFSSCIYPSTRRTAAGSSASVTIAERSSLLSLQQQQKQYHSSALISNRSSSSSSSSSMSPAAEHVADEGKDAGRSTPIPTQPDPGHKPAPETGWEGEVPSRNGGDGEKDFRNKPPYKWSSDKFVKKYERCAPWLCSSLGAVAARLKAERLISAGHARQLVLVRKPQVRVCRRPLGL